VANVSYRRRAVRLHTPPPFPIPQNGTRVMAAAVRRRLYEIHMRAENLAATFAAAWKAGMRLDEPSIEMEALSEDELQDVHQEISAARIGAASCLPVVC